MKSIIITHQLHLQMPTGSFMLYAAANAANHKLISKFDECWIPDVPTEKNLSGILSHPALDNCRYIGVLSRFSPIEKKAKKYAVMALLSGPEPQRSILEKIILDELKNHTFPSLVVKGKLQEVENENLPNVETINFLTHKALATAINDSKILICRSGYSTIMDLACLMADVKVIFVPTPGQTEQEYLAEKFAAEKIAVQMVQKDFSLSKAIEKAKKNESFDKYNYMAVSSTLLSQALTSVITA